MNSKQPILVIITLAIVSAGFSYLFVWPNYQVWSQKNQTLQSIKNGLDDLTAKQALYEELAKAETTLTEMSQKALEFVPISENREQFANELDLLAQSNNLTLNTLNFSNTAIAKKKAKVDETTADEELSPGTAAKTPSVTSVKKTAEGSNNLTLDYNATLSGSYSSVEKFLNQLNYTKRYTLLKTFEILAQNSPINNSTQPSDPTATPLPSEPLISLTLTGSIFNKPIPKRELKASDKLSPQDWQYLVDRANAPTNTSGKNPFAPYE